MFGYISAKEAAEKWDISQNFNIYTNDTQTFLKVTKKFL